MSFNYIKALKDWFELKVMLWEKNKKLVFKEQEVWWCSLGMNLGEEIYGKGIKFTRPILIFKKFTGNSFLAIPLTTQEKTGSWYVSISIHGRKNYAMLNQTRILDKKRLTNRIATLDDGDFKLVKESFLKFYS